MGLAVLFSYARRDDPPTLAFPIRKVAIVVDDNVAGFTGRLGADNTLGGNDLAHKGGLVLERVDGYRRLVPVRRSLEEILLAGRNRRAVVINNRSS
jgi:hypothetical protein